MQNTVIGVYDNYSQARAAYNDLVARGYNMTNIQLSPDQEGHEARSSVLKNRDDSEDGFGLGNFFRSLFGTDESQANHHDAYHEAVRRGSYLVSVQTDSDALGKEACQIMERFDPVDIDERSAQWRTQGWSGYDRDAAIFTDEEVQRDRDLYRAPAVAESALDQRVRVYGVDPALATTRNTEGATGVDDFRTHWQDSYSNLGGRYEDIEPAYRFGSESRSNQNYRGRSWNEVEPELQRDWQGRQADTPWEHVKAAIRHAWEKIPG
jgi:hypothetical protein